MTEDEALNLLNSIIRLASVGALATTEASSLREARMRLALAQIQRLAREAIKDAERPERAG